MSDVSATAKPLIGRGFRLQWEPAQNAHVLLYPEGMVRLNASAGEIMRRCTGDSTLAQIIADLEQTFGATGITDDVTSFIVIALEKKWLEVRA